MQVNDFMPFHKCNNSALNSMIQKKTVLSKNFKQHLHSQDPKNGDFATKRGKATPGRRR
jgi:hypothetical protein